MINAAQSISVVLIIGVTSIIAWRIAPYITRVFTRSPSRLDRIINPIENFLYKLTGVDTNHSMGWKEYFLSGLILNILQMAIAFLILMFQDRLPLNPQGFPGLNWDLSLHTVVSFATNTNLQHYNGETTLSYLSQMTAIQFLQFTSAATGICVGIAMIRGFVTDSRDMGNFYVDFIRTLTRLLIPFCFIASLILVLLGVPQSLSGYTTVKTVEGATQSILVGPVASLVSIMQLGTNGGGYYGANSAHPFMNPNPISNILEIGLMLLLPVALIFVFGQLLGKKSETKPILIAVYCLFAINLIIAFISKFPAGEAIDVRIGGFFSTFWTVTTTSTMTGSLNSSLFAMHPFTILAAFIGMFIQGAPGGIGFGLAYMIMYVVITVFIVGLMSGRTPNYLGIKIAARDVKLVMITFIIHPIIILIPTILTYASGAAASIGVGVNSLGFVQILYEFTTSAANNGSDFLGAIANTPFFNISTAIVIFIGRYIPMGLMLALAGSMIGRRRSIEVGIKTESNTFSLVLLGSIIILVVLTFFPFLALGPILSYLQGNVNFFG